MADEWVIETVGLCKRYGDVEALRGLELRVPRGSIYGFLGRNGAGKTTTLKILMGMVRPSAGTARVFGRSAVEQASSVDIRRRVGFVSDEKDLYDSMTVEELNGDLRAANRDLGKAIHRAPDDWQLWFVRARLEVKSGDVGGARERHGDLVVEDDAVVARPVLLGQFDLFEVA